MHDIGETFEKKVLGRKGVHFLCYVHIFSYFVQWAAFEKFGMFDLGVT